MEEVSLETVNRDRKFGIPVLNFLRTFSFIVMLQIISYQQSRDSSFDNAQVLKFVRGLGWRSGLGAALLVVRSRDQFPMVSLDFSVTHSFRRFHDPGVDSAPSENEYQEYFLEVKAAGA
jgi:hypothetical protein